MSCGSKTATGVKAPALPERTLRWDGGVNVSDLAGLPLAGGGAEGLRRRGARDHDRLPDPCRWGCPRRLRRAGRGRPRRGLGRGEGSADEVPIEVRRFPVDGNEIEVVREWRTMHEAYHGM